MSLLGGSLEAGAGPAVPRSNRWRKDSKGESFRSVRNMAGCYSRVVHKLFLVCFWVMEVSVNDKFGKLIYIVKAVEVSVN